MDLPKITYTHTLQLIFIFELLFLVTNTIKCYRIGRCVGSLQSQFQDGIIDQDTFQQLYTQEIDKSLIVKLFVAVGSSLGFMEQTKEVSDAVVCEKGVWEEKAWGGVLKAVWQTCLICVWLKSSSAEEVCMS